MTKQEREKLQKDWEDGHGLNAHQFNALLDHIDALEERWAKFQPVDAILVDDCDEGSDKRYGRVLISTENCIRTLYRNMAFDAAIASAPEVNGGS